MLSTPHVARPLSAPASSHPPAPGDLRLWAWGSLVLAALGLGALALQPDVAGARQLIRLTAWTSLLAFLLAHMASTGWRLWPGALSRQLLVQRRSLGLLMFSSHLLHAMGIAVLAGWADPALWAQLTPWPSRVIGGSGYLALFAMAATSWDGAQRWLGWARWHRLHSVCGWVIWLVYLLAMLKRAPAMPGYGLAALALLALGALKVWAQRMTRSA